MADAVGGVPICVTKPIDDPDSGLKLPAGRSVISGRTALAYLRSRHGVGDGSDLSRIGSQQAYMSSLLRTMMSRDTFTNPVKLYGLAQAAAQNVRLSQSLASEDTIVTMALALKGMNLQHLVFVQYPSGADPQNPNKVVPNTELADLLMRRIRADLPVALDASSLGLSTELAPTAKGEGRDREHDDQSTASVRVLDAGSRRRPRRPSSAACAGRRRPSRPAPSRAADRAEPPLGGSRRSAPSPRRPA